jgi:hypothetical protein
MVSAESSEQKEQRAESREQRAHRSAIDSQLEVAAIPVLLHGKIVTET